MEYSVSSACYYSQKSVGDIFQSVLRLKELFINDTVNVDLGKYADIENGGYFPDTITKFKLKDLNHPRDFNFSDLENNDFCMIYINGSFPLITNSKPTLLTHHFNIRSNQTTLSTLPEQGIYFVPNIGTNNDVELSQVKLTQEKLFSQLLKVILITDSHCLITERSGIEIVDELVNGVNREFQNNVLYTDVPPKHHWFIYLEEGAKTDFNINKNMRCFNFYKGKLWVNPHFFLGDTQAIIDKVSDPNYNYQVEWVESK
ncbi:hypothetical protein [Caldalkalibacillus salinus]|uniref:hypothetical protein n=1 Tax=Caldalkalibacillus salinus TaxID=2803787 RepID=UPI00192393EB|nr:hypothetical protein [Caldalkalibacillus salinus]